MLNSCLRHLSITAQAHQAPNTQRYHKSLNISLSIVASLDSSFDNAITSLRTRSKPAAVQVPQTGQGAERPQTARRG